MKYFGYLLTFAGFLGAAYLASLDPKSVNWTYFAVAAAAGFGGVILAKRAAHAAAQSDHVLIGNRKELLDSLSNIIRVMEDMKARKDSIDIDAFRTEIDARLRGDLIRFVEARESLTHLYGLRVYADVMSAFATGERHVNRIWSASADGYIDEARAYVDYALEQFQEAQVRLSAAMG